MLQDLLTSIHNKFDLKPINPKEDPLLMIAAFIKMEQQDPFTIKANQKLVKKYLLPAITCLKDVPDWEQDNIEQLLGLYRACIKLLLDRDDVAITPQIYVFGHSIGSIRIAATELGQDKEAMKAFGSFLSSFGFN